MNLPHWIFISPHLDDVALSCGGLVWTLSQQGHKIEVWTLFAGLPPDKDYSPFAMQIHHTWGITGAEAIRHRRAEDHAACAVLGAAVRHFDWPDAIYRHEATSGRFIVNNEEELFGNPSEPSLVREIADLLKEQLPKESQLVLPIGLGGHVDHQAAVLAGERLGGVEHFYADYPYILEHFDSPALHDGSLENIPHHLTEDALEAWQTAVLCYTSQLSTFWRDERETRLALRNYLAGGGGRLWRICKGKS
jgi:LmbE family N-acetylglucosaminyl deacetylase